MEISEAAVIAFLLVIIVILIFSNITVSFGSTDDNTSDSSGSSSLPTTPSTPTITTPKPTKFDPLTSDLLSNDIKKQLKDLDTMYYTNTCKI